MKKSTLATIIGAAALGIAKKGIDGSVAKVKADVDLFEYNVLDRQQHSSYYSSYYFFSYFQCRYSINEQWGSCGGFKSTKAELKEISKYGHQYIQSIAFTEVREGKFPPVNLYNNLESLYVQGTYRTIPEDIFSNLKWMKSLFLNGSTLGIPKSIGQLTRLKHLVIKSDAEKTSEEMDLSVLQNCKKLEILYLKGGNLINLDALKSLVNLKKLYIYASSTRILDLSAILECKKIEELIVRTECTTFILGDLSSLSKLKRVDIYNIMGQTNLDSLGSLPNLKELTIVQDYTKYSSSVPKQCLSHSNYPTSQLEFKDFKKLEKLSFTGKRLVVNFKEGSLPNLQELKACSWGQYAVKESRGWGRGTATVYYKNSIASIKGIEYLTSLKSISVNFESPFSSYYADVESDLISSNIQNIFRLKKIKEINISSSAYKSVAADNFINLIPKDLKCTKLEELQLSEILIKEIPSSIQKCKKLRYISISVIPNQSRWGTNIWPIKDGNGTSDFDMKIPPQIVKCSSLTKLSIKGMNIQKQFPYESFIHYGQKINVLKSKENGMEVEKLQTSNLSDKLFYLFLSSPILVSSNKPKSWLKESLLEFDSLKVQYIWLKFKSKLIPSISISSDDIRINTVRLSLIEEKPDRGYDEQGLSSLIKLECDGVRGFNTAVKVFSKPIFNGSTKHLSIKEGWKHASPESISLHLRFYNNEGLKDLNKVNELHLERFLPDLVLPYGLERLSYSLSSLSDQKQIEVFNNLNKQGIRTKQSILSLNFSHVSIPLPPLIKGFSELVNIRFYKVNMLSFPTWIFHSKKLRSLNFFDVPLWSIPENIAQELPELSSLDINQTNIRKIPLGLLISPKFTHLEVGIMEPSWRNRLYMSTNENLVFNRIDLIKVSQHFSKKFNYKDLLKELKKMVLYTESKTSNSQLRRF